LAEVKRGSPQEWGEVGTGWGKRGETLAKIAKIAKIAKAGRIPGRAVFFLLGDLGDPGERISSSSSLPPHPPEQLVLVPPAQPQHLSCPQLHFVVALEQRRERLDRRYIHRRRLVDACELLIPELFEQVLQRASQDVVARARMNVNVVVA